MRGTLIFGATLFAGGAAHADTEPTTEVFFDFDSDVLQPGATDKLEAFARQLEDNPAARIVVAGHADSTGASTYNIVLSARRAEVVRRALEYRGVDGKRVVLAIYGEDAPRRGDHAQDRRVTVTATDDPLYKIVDERLGVATALMWDQPVSVAEIDGPQLDQVAREESAEE